MRNQSKQNLFQRMFEACKVVLRGGSSLSSGQNISDQEVPDYMTYSPKQQDKINGLCEQLFNQKDLIATGRLQFLGLNRVRQSLGKTWDGLKPIIFSTVEKVLQKYLHKDDLFLRYQDDMYVVIFMHDNEQQAYAKSILIAEEIRAALYEYAEKNMPELDTDELGLQNSITMIRTKSMQGAGNLTAKMDVIMKTMEEQGQQGPSLELLPTIEIDPYKHYGHDQISTDISQDAHLDCLFVPVWDVPKDMFSSYVCLPQSPLEHDSVFEGYHMLFMGIPNSLKCETDIRILKQAAQQSRRMQESHCTLSVICPVHYETLMSDSCHEAYIKECQKISQDDKKLLILLVVDIPEKLPKINMEKYFGAVRKHCSALYAKVPLTAQTDFLLLSGCHFDAVGARLPQHHIDESKLAADLEHFAKLANDAMITKMFVFDIPSLSLGQKAAQLGFSFISGNDIHKPVSRPGLQYEFEHKDTFAVSSQS